MLSILLAAAAVLNLADPPKTLPEARALLKSEILDRAPKGDGSKPDQPPPGCPFELITYKSPAGELAAYLTPDPKDGKKHPAIIVCTGGFGGIGDSSWTVERYTGHFRKAGLVVMCPSWRGQQSNPGRWEAFRGEIDDAIAAVDHIRALPYVDASRVYITGHSTGGTVSLMVAECTDKVRAAFPLGPCFSCSKVIHDDKVWGMDPPFDLKNEEEIRARSPLEFVATVKAPTFSFEGRFSPNNKEAPRANELADAAKAPFHAYTVELADHFTLVDCINALIASKIAADTGRSCAVAITDDEVQRAYANRRMPFTPRKDLDPAAPILRLTEPAKADIIKAMKDQEKDPAKVYLRIGIDGYFRQEALFSEKPDEDDLIINMGEFKVLMDPLSIFLMRGTVIGFSDEQGLMYDNPNEN